MEKCPQVGVKYGWERPDAHDMSLLWTNPAIGLPVLGIVMWTIASCVRLIASELAEHHERCDLRARVRALQAAHAKRHDELTGGHMDVDIIGTVVPDVDVIHRSAA